MASDDESDAQNPVPGFQHEPAIYYFSDFVELQIKSPSNDFSDWFYLDIRTTIGEHYLSFELSDTAISRMFHFLKPTARAAHHFKIRLLQCKLRYELIDCSIPIEDKYRYSAQAGTLSLEVQERFKIAMGIRSGGALAIAAKVGLAESSAKIDAKTSVASIGSTNETDETSTKIKPEIAVVEHCPSGWTIGHGSLGHPLQATSNYCLNGSYFHQKVKAHDHTCKVEFEPRGSVAELTFTLSVRDAFYVERIERGLSRKLDGEQKSQVIEEMRRRMAGFVVEKLLKSSDKSLVDNHELVLARFTATARRSKPEPAIMQKSISKKAPPKRKLNSPSSNPIGRRQEMEE